MITFIIRLTDAPSVMAPSAHLSSMSFVMGASISVEVMSNCLNTDVHTFQKFDAEVCEAEGGGGRGAQSLKNIISEGFARKVSAGRRARREKGRVERKEREDYPWIYMKYRRRPMYCPSISKTRVMKTQWPLKSNI